MKIKPFWTMLLIVGLLAGCGSSASPSATTEPADVPTDPAGDETATTILRFAVSEMERNTYDSLIDAFEAENPDVHISIVSVEETLGTGMGMGNSEWPDDAYLLLAASADVIGALATRQAVQQGALLDLSQFFESDSTLTTDAFYPGLLESVEWEGGIWSVPTEATYMLIYYDKTLFDAGGVAYPQPGWTWDDFLATAKALTIRDGDTASQWGFVEQSFDPVTIVQARAGLLFDPDTYPPTARLDDAAVIEAVRWYTDLFLTDKVAPYYSTSEQGGAGGMFENEGMRAVNSGQAAMWFTSSGGFQQRGRPGEQQQNTGTVPFPVDNAGDSTTPVVVDGFSISAGTKKADLAWRWISFLAQQQTVTRPQGGGQGGPSNQLNSRTLPALPSVTAAAGYWDNLDEEFATALKYAIEHAYVDTYDGVGYDTFNSAVLEVMDNGAAVESALATAQTTVEAEIEEEVAAAPTPVANLIVAEEEQEALNAGAVIITFGRSGGGRFGQGSLTTLVEQFEAAHPDVIVEIESPQGFRGQLDLVDMAAEYDCFQASPSFSDDTLAAILNMEPFLAADSSVSKEDFFPSVLEQFSYQGQVWGLPASVTVNLMNYNKDLFDAANLDYPGLDWTTGDFLEMAVALTKGTDENAQYGYVPAFSEINDLINIMDRLGADTYDDSVDPPRLVFNSAQVVAAMRWYTSLTLQYHVTPVIDEDTDEPGGVGRERQNLINQGRAAMWMASGGGQSFGGFGGQNFGFAGPNQTGEINTGVVPLPAGANSAQGSGFQSTEGYFISAQTQAREACWSWITFLTEQPNVTSGLPARQSVAQSAEYRQQVGEETADAYLASVSSGSQASFFQRISDEGNWLGFASSWLSVAYDRIMSGEMTVEESLDAAQEMVDAYRDCIIANDAFQDREAMQECVSEVGGTTQGLP